MEESFYRDRLEQRYGLTVVTPDQKERDHINDVIFNQLCADVYTPEARREFVRIIERLVRDDGAQGVILGCTEIPRLVPQKYVSVPVFDSTSLHAQAALDYALGERPID
jgi:aspartate racemase